MAEPSSPLTTLSEAQRRQARILELRSVQKKRFLAESARINHKMAESAFSRIGFQLAPEAVCLLRSSESESIANRDYADNSVWEVF